MEADLAGLMWGVHHEVQCDQEADLLEKPPAQDPCNKIAVICKGYCNQA